MMASRDANGMVMIIMPKSLLSKTIYNIFNYCDIIHRFYPLTQKVSVGNAPVEGITFSQLKGKLSGKIQCKEAGACVNIPVTLRPLSADGGYVGQPMSTVAVGECSCYSGF